MWKTTASVCLTSTLSLYHRDSPFVIKPEVTCWSFESTEGKRPTWMSEGPGSIHVAYVCCDADRQDAVHQGDEATVPLVAPGPINSTQDKVERGYFQGFSYYWEQYRIASDLSFKYTDQVCCVFLYFNRLLFNLVFKQTRDKLLANNVFPIFSIPFSVLLI